MNPHIISGYQLIGPIASGSCGEVWEAEVLRGKLSTRPAAVKIGYCAVDSLEAKNELRSLQMAASLEIPGFIPILEITEAMGRLVLVMDLAVGTIWQLSHNYQQHVIETLRVLISVAHTLDFLSSHGIVHGGITPSEIVICKRQPYLIDYSLMHRIIDPFPQVARINLLTWACMSPEMRNRATKLQSDQYSLAASYTMLRLSKLPSLNPFVGQALSEKPGKRFQTCSEFVSQLETAVRLDGLDSVKGDSVN
jgi:serine/threonine protein kinase